MNPITALKSAGSWLLTALVALITGLALHNRNRAQKAESEARAQAARALDIEARADASLEGRGTVKQEQGAQLSQRPSRSDC